MKNKTLNSVFIIITALFAVSWSFVSYKENKNCPDLVVREILQPIHTDSGGINGSVITVMIQNIGKLPSKETKAKIYVIAKLVVYKFQNQLL